jgi:hypothetical protein
MSNLFIKGLGRHPRRARFARSTTRMSFAQARAAALSHRSRKARFAAAIMTVLTTTVFPIVASAVKAFAFASASRYSNLFSSVASRFARTVLIGKKFSFTRALAGDCFGLLWETVVAIRR